MKIIVYLKWAVKERLCAAHALRLGEIIPEDGQIEAVFEGGHPLFEQATVLVLAALLGGGSFGYFPRKGQLSLYLSTIHISETDFLSILKGDTTAFVLSHLPQLYGAYLPKAREFLKKGVWGEVYS